MLARLLIAVLAAAGMAHSGAQAEEVSLAPCKAASDMDSNELVLAARLARQFGRDRAPIEAGGWPRMRIHVLPDYTAGYSEGPPEWLVSLYIPEEGQPILELALPEGSIRGANSAWVPVPGKEGTWEFRAHDDEHPVPVQFHAKELPRDLAERVAIVVNSQIAQARIATGSPTMIRIHGNTYQFSAWELGHGDRCARMNAHVEEFEKSDLGKLTLALRQYVESTKRAPKTKEISERLEALENQ